MPLCVEPSHKHPPLFLVKNSHSRCEQAFNPLLFLRDGHTSAENGNFASCLALAARNSISIWLTSLSRPLCVAHEVLDRDVLDLAWSSDGRTLYACSSDGHVCVFTFDLSELPSVVPPGTVESWFSHFGFRKSMRQRQPVSVNHQAVGTFAQPNVLGVRKPASVNVAAEQKVTVVNGKKRIQPAFLGGLGIAEAPRPQALPHPPPSFQALPQQQPAPTRPQLLQASPHITSPQTRYPMFGQPQQGSSRDLDIARLDARMDASGVFGSHQLVRAMLAWNHFLLCV
jgi:hypothetical protein